MSALLRPAEQAYLLALLELSVAVLCFGDEGFEAKLLMSAVDHGSWKAGINAQALVYTELQMLDQHGGTHLQSLDDMFGGDGLLAALLTDSVALRGDKLDPFCRVSYHSGQSGSVLSPCVTAALR